jgi:putative peptide zinc metalloprotease protein
MLGLDRRTAAANRHAAPPGAANGHTAPPGATPERAAPATSRPDAPSPPVTVIPERPRRHLDALIEEGPPGEAFFVVSDARRSIYLRLKAPQARFLESLDGERAVEEISAAPGELDARLVVPLLARFTQLGLLDGTEPMRSEAQAKRVRTGDKTRLQYTLADPDGLLDRLLPLIRALGSPAGLAAATLVCAVALVVFATRADLAALTGDYVADPLVIGTVILATLATVMLHELGHAGAVKYHGGHVHRLGFMLFYLAPAMFCDTSDSWRFPRRAQRAAVSLAGIGVQLVVTALVVLLLALPLGDWLTAWITLYAFINFGMCMLNAVPFVKLDGYWTLVAVSDRPNLRAESTGLVREHVRRAIFGLRRPLQPLPVPWAHFVFGLACLLFAPLLVSVVVLRYQGWALQLGWIGASCWLLLAMLVVMAPCHGLATAVRGAWAERPAAGARGVALIAVLAAALVGGLWLVPVRLTVEGDFNRTGPRTVQVELPEARSASVRVGDRVALDDGSFAAPKPVGDGTVVALDGDRASAGVDRVVYAAGHARVNGRERPAPVWFFETYVLPPFRSFL